MTGGVGAGNVRSQHGLTAQVQRGDRAILTQRFARRLVMLGQIVDEEGMAGAIFVDDRAQGRPLRPLVGVDFRGDPVAVQLILPGIAVIIHQIGQYHYVSVL